MLKSWKVKKKNLSYLFISAYFSNWSCLYNIIKFKIHKYNADNVHEIFKKKMLFFFAQMQKLSWKQQYLKKI